MRFVFVGDKAMSAEFDTAVKKKITKLELKIKELQQKHYGNEQQYTYHGGWDLGYLQGKLAGIELILDLLEIDYDN